MSSSCQESVLQDKWTVLNNSGRFFQDLGNYYDCLDSPGMIYNYITFKLKSYDADSGMIGLCLPKQCGKQQIESTLNGFFNQFLPTIQVKNIQNNVPGYQYQFSWAFYLTIAIIISTLALVIFSSLFPKEKMFSMFSIQQSIKLFKRNPQSNLNVLNGVRSISMMWVIIGHTFQTMVLGSINSQTSLQKNSFLQPFFLVIEAGLLSVDIFFFIAGFLLAYVFLKDTSNSKVKYPAAIFQRVLRLWPSYFFAILFYYSIYLHLGSGPLWGSDQYMVKFCDKMWKPLLFVDNLVDNGEQLCLDVGWYLQNDMQLFILSIGLLFIYSLKPIISKILIEILIISSTVYIFVYTLDHNTLVITHFSDLLVWGNYFQDVYIKPWARAPPYVFGLYIGMIYHQYLVKKKIQKSSVNDYSDYTLKGKSNFLQFCEKAFSRKFIRIFVEWFGIALMLFVVFIPRTLQVDVQWPQWLHFLYQSSAKLIFIFALFMTILPSLLGFKHSIINFCLDTQYFNFIAKVSFCTYLIHLTLINVWLYSRTYTRYFTIKPTIAQFFSFLAISLAMGLLMTLTIQIPFSKLQKKLIQGIKSKSSNKSIEGPQQKQQDQLSKSLLTVDSSQQMIANKQFMEENKS